VSFFLYIRVRELLIWKIARNLIKENDLRRLIFHASANGSLIAKPSWGLVGELTPDGNGLRCLLEEKHLVLGDQGKKTPRSFIYSLVYQVILTYLVPRKHL
jgi:hypothetical protein